MSRIQDHSHTTTRPPFDWRPVYVDGPLAGQSVPAERLFQPPADALEYPSPSSDAVSVYRYVPADQNYHYDPVACTESDGSF